MMAGQVGSRRILRVLGLVAATFGFVALILFWYIRPEPYEPPPPDSELVDVDYEKPFELEDAIPSLYRAAGMSPKDAVRLLLQNSAHLRTYVAIELRASCSYQPLDPICIANLGDRILEEMITRKIDEIIMARIDSRGAFTSVDSGLLRQPFPFTAIAALKSNSRSYASLAFSLPNGNGYTLSSIKSRYGAPHERTMDAQSLTVLSYTTKAKNYTASIEFQIDTKNRAARQVSISLRRHGREQ